MIALEKVRVVLVLHGSISIVIAPHLLDHHVWIGLRLFLELLFSTLAPTLTLFVSICVI